MRSLACDQGTASIHLLVYSDTMGRFAMRTLVVWLVTGCGLFLPVRQAGAQVTRTLTVDESVQLGLENNERLQAARADAAEAQAINREARAARWPQLQLQGGFTRLGG